LSAGLGGSCCIVRSPGEPRWLPSSKRVGQFLPELVDIEVARFALRDFHSLDRVKDTCDVRIILLPERERLNLRPIEFAETPEVSILGLLRGRRARRRESTFGPTRKVSDFEREDDPVDRRSVFLSLKLRGDVRVNGHSEQSPATLVFSPMLRRPVVALPVLATEL
jgi:hypothetical protein